MPQDNRQKWSQVVAKASHDNNFKKKLLANPREVLESEGVAVSKTAKIHVVENTEKDIYLVLPDAKAAQLNKDALLRSSGGAACCNTMI